MPETTALGHFNYFCYSAVHVVNMTDVIFGVTPKKHTTPKKNMGKTGHTQILQRKKGQKTSKRQKQGILVQLGNFCAITTLLCK